MTHVAVETIEKSASDHAESLKRILDSTLGEITFAVQTTKTSLDQLDIPKNLITSKLSPALEETHASIIQFKDKVDNIDLPKDAVSRKLETAFSGFEDQMGRLTKVVKRHAEEAEMTRSQWNRFTDIVAGADKTMAQYRTQLEGSLESVRISTAQTVQHIDLLTGQVTSLCNIFKKLESAQIKVSKMQIDLNKLNYDAEQDLIKMRATLTESAKIFHETVRQAVQEDEKL